ncbi:MAG: hypothetical protein FWH08_05215 [Oscillospiraceae bacterium]|nr:hypothetical protein [Oscillospiraceae bacterium]
MTRKQALQKALSALDLQTDFEAIAKINEIIEALPFTAWTEQTIFDTIDQFILDNGRNPTATDFLMKDMPPHTVIKLRFGVNLKEFLAQYYPKPKIDIHKQKAVFISEYERIKPKGASDFNKGREGGIPTWVTFAKMFGLSKWLEWISFCGLEKSSPALIKRTRETGLVVVPYNDIFMNLERFNEMYPPITEEEIYRRFPVD